MFSPKLRKQKGLQRFVYVNRYGGASIDYSDPKALEELTRSLLAEFYQITWRLPDGSLANLVTSKGNFFCENWWVATHIFFKCFTPKIGEDENHFDDHIFPMG